MYDVALSVLSCLRAGTEVHVAWAVSGTEDDGVEAVALTPGGGRMGALLGGALDHAISEALPGLGDHGGLLDVTIGTVESLMSGLPEGAELTVAVVPGTALPGRVWADLAARRPVSFALDLDGRRFSRAEVLDPVEPGMVLTEDRLVCSLEPVPRVVIAGSGPIADALSEVFTVAGWQAAVLPGADAATGLMATLSPIDAAIVMGHDVETSARSLQAAIASDAGYIGSIGSPRMQELREEWLSYRGVGWPDRVHGPAGFPIGAQHPGEIAVSIVAEAIGFLRRPRDPNS